MDPRLDPASLDRIAPSRRGHARPRVLDVMASVADVGYVIRAAEGLRDRGFDVRLVSGGDELADVEASRIAHTFLPWLDRDLGFGDDLRVLASLAGIVRRWRPDVVHTRSAKAGALGRTIAIRGRVPIILHSFDRMRASDLSEGPRRAAVIERRLATRTDALIAGSLRLRDDLLAGGIGRPTQWHVMQTDGDPKALADLVGGLLERAADPRAGARNRSAPSPVPVGPDVRAVATVGGRG
jgi:hypothetical protein